MDTRIKTIWTHYRQFNQLEKTIEELDELKAEVVKFLRFVKSTDNRFTAVARSKSEFLKIHPINMQLFLYQKKEKRISNINKHKNCSLLILA